MGFQVLFLTVKTAVVIKGESVLVKDKKKQLHKNTRETTKGWNFEIHNFRKGQFQKETKGCHCHQRGKLLKHCELVETFSFQKKKGTGILTVYITI